jgi:hypothetical protein
MLKARLETQNMKFEALELEASYANNEGLKLVIQVTSV